MYGSGGGGRGAKPTFWRPHERDDSVTFGNISAEKIDEDVTIPFNPHKNMALDRQKRCLPVFDFRLDILYLVQTCRVTIIEGETGSGKSTQICQYLYESGWCDNGQIVGVTQPRRIAAITLANRVADEMPCVIGREVGYCVRFDECFSRKTRLKFLSDGMLIREMMKDPLLNEYSVIIVDEAHERLSFIGEEEESCSISLSVSQEYKYRYYSWSLTEDFNETTRFEDYYFISYLGHENFRVRDFFTVFRLPESATSDMLKPVGLLTITGRQYPVNVFYLNEPCHDYVISAAETVIKIHKNEPAGDILVFLPGQEDIHRCVNNLEDAECKKMEIFLLHGSLPFRDQIKAFQSGKYGIRKVVVATNIAETSVTIPNIVYCIDSGFVKIKLFNNDCLAESLNVVPVSKSAANQRCGRAGRERAGCCYRLYTETSFEKLLESTPPELQRCDLSYAILQLKALGIVNLAKFNYVSQPPAQNVIRALDFLIATNALDEEGELTENIGLIASELPLAPQMSICILAAAMRYGCVDEILTIVAMLQIKNVFVYSPHKRISADKAKRKFAVFEGDLITMLNVYTIFESKGYNASWCGNHCLNYKGLMRAKEIKQQLTRILNRLKVPVSSIHDSTSDITNVIKSLIAGLFVNVAKQDTDCVSYRTPQSNYKLHIHPNSVLYTEKQPKWVMFSELVQSGKDYMADVTVVQPEWLQEVVPHYYSYR